MDTKMMEHRFTHYRTPVKWEPVLTGMVKQIAHLMQPALIDGLVPVIASLEALHTDDPAVDHGYPY